MVHQHSQIVPRLSVAENVILGSGEHRNFRLPDLAVVATWDDAAAEPQKPVAEQPAAQRPAAEELATEPPSAEE